MNNTIANPDAAIRLGYFLRVRNIGDVLSANVVSSVAQRPTTWFRGNPAQHLLAIGSILGGANQNSIVWGTGLMFSNQIPQITASNVYALRGKLTYSTLQASGSYLPDVPLGDPAWLIPPSLLKMVPAKKYRIGFIPHYVDRQHPFFRHIQSQDDVLDVNVHSSPAQFFEALQSCESIISSSLHGLVLAESLGIPNLWIELSDRVAGSGFKFRDWFSLAERPQNEPYLPTGSETVSDLASCTRVHDMKIDRSQLAASFPFDKIEALSSQATDRPFIALSKCRTRPLPIFIISYNRGAFLERTIASYRRLDRPVQIIIHDNGSEDVHTLAVLDRLEAEGCVVYRRHKIENLEELNNTNETVEDFFRAWAEPSRYVVTDCDIDLSLARPDVLDLYDELLDLYPTIQCVGPMLRIRDVSEQYPLFKSVMTRHIEQFWHKTPDWIDTKRARVATIECRIDTTFALHRAGEAFFRQKTARRVYHPYEAQHLDWYYDPITYNKTRFFETSANVISHWNNKVAHEQFILEDLKYDRFYYVEEDDCGKLVVKTHHLNRPAS